MIKETISLLLFLLFGFALVKHQQFNKKSDEMVRVGCNADFKPFEFKKDSTYVGFDIDIWDAVAKKMNIAYKLVPMNSTSLISSLQTRKIDVAIAGLVMSTERKHIVDFSCPYYNSGFAIAVRANDTQITNIDALKDRTIGMIPGTTSADFARTILCHNIKQFPNTNDAFLDLQSRGTDAIILDLPAIQYYCNTDGKGEVKILKPIYKKEPVGFAFTIGSKFKQKADTAIFQLIENNVYDSIYRKWFGEPDLNERVQLNHQVL